jgi:hypothetical protein
MMPAFVEEGGSHRLLDVRRIIEAKTAISVVN